MALSKNAIYSFSNMSGSSTVTKTQLIEKPSPESEEANKANLKKSLEKEDNASFSIPLDHSESEKDINNVSSDSSINSPGSTSVFRGLSEALNSAAVKLTHDKVIDGFQLLGCLMKFAQGAIAPFAKDDLDKQKTGELVIDKLGKIAPEGLEPQTAFTWKDPNLLGSDYHFQVDVEEDKNGRRFKTIVAEDMTTNQEVFKAKAEIHGNNHTPVWQVQKNDFSEKQLESLIKGEYKEPKQKNKTKQKEIER